MLSGPAYFSVGKGRSRLTFRIYDPGDFDRLTPRADMADLPRPAWADCQRPKGSAWTITRGAGRKATPIAIAGAEIRKGEFLIWAFLADMTPRQWVFARRCTRAALASLGAGAIWAAVLRPEHAAFLSRLGFSDAGPGLTEADTPCHLMLRKAA